MTFSYTLNNDSVEVEYSASVYIPPNLSGHPDSWTPEEGGEIEIEAVEYETNGRVMIDGKWVAVKRVIVDVSPLLSDYQLEEICQTILNAPIDDEP